MKAYGLLIFVVCFCSASQASVISYGDYQWDQNTSVIVDSGANIEWFRWTETKGQSIKQALSENSSDGWRLASNSEMTRLFSDFFKEKIWLADENQYQSSVLTFDNFDDPHSQFITLFGATLADNECWANETSTTTCHDNPRNATAASFGSDLDEDGRFNTALVSDEYVKHNLEHDITAERAEYANLSSDSRSLTNTNQLIGVALVRDVTSVSVPEPSPVFIFAFGMAILALSRKFRRNLI